MELLLTCQHIDLILPEEFPNFCVQLVERSRQEPMKT